MSLNELASTPRSGSSVGASRVSSRPPAIALAASEASATGRTARRAASTPTSTPSPVVIVAARNSERATLESVSLSSLEAEELEVLGVDAVEADADDLERLAVDLGDHARVDVVDRSPGRAAPRGSTARSARCSAMTTHRSTAATNGPAPLLSNVIGDGGHLGVLALQPAVDEAGVAVRLGDARTVALARQVGAHESVGREGEKRGESERAEGEDQQDPPAQPERSGTTGEQAEPPAPSRRTGIAVSGAARLWLGGLRPGGGDCSGASVTTSLTPSITPAAGTRGHGP